jgi:NAD(P)-dependent dehydrogenase (short-subunit alcohol dehydrogenase family)
VDELSGKVAVITGAASGIGLAVTEALVAEGAKVVLADRNEELLAAATERLAGDGHDVIAVVTDVSDPDSVDRLGRAVIERYGALHLAMNNAGIVNGGNSWELPLAEWHRVVDINLWGVIHGIRTFVPLILATGEPGHVVNTASMAAVVAIAGLGPYTVSKHAILGLSDVLRAELVALEAPVGVSVVLPGMIKTGMNPIGSISASTVAANVLDAIRRNRPYVFTDHHSTKQVEARLGAIVAARADVLPG